MFGFELPPSVKELFSEIDVPMKIEATATQRTISIAKTALPDFDCFFFTGFS